MNGLRQAVKRSLWMGLGAAALLVAGCASGGSSMAGATPVTLSGSQEVPPRVIVPLVKAGDGIWTVGTGAKLSDAQYAAFKAGNTYVNVHSDANKGGEIRGQLKP
jgi:hypothetical protein